MKISVEISKYPLGENYIPAIQGFIDRLKTHHGITVMVNTMSTQVFGEFDAVTNAIQKEMKTSFEQDLKQVLVMKFINSDLTP